jgi:hypothetical protein
MHNDSQKDNQPANEASSHADAASAKAWSDFEQDLDSLGRQLAELGTHGAALGGYAVNSLQARFDEVKRRASFWKQTTEQQVEELRRSAWQQASDAQGAYGEARVRSKEAARQMWERSEPLRQGARDVGEGLTRAWSELRASLGKAASRIQTESAPRSPSSSPSSDKQPGST